MALSATISLAQTPIGYNQQSSASVTVSNSGGSPVTITGFAPQILATGAPTYQTNIDSQASLPTLAGINALPLTVPASGSLVVAFAYNVFSPQVAEAGNLDQSVPTTYAVGCIVDTSDGSRFSPTPATVTITPISAN
jgi:hypothetical protein